MADRWVDASRRRAHLGGRSTRQISLAVSWRGGQRLRLAETLRADARRQVARPGAQIRDACDRSGRALGREIRPAQVLFVDRRSWSCHIPLGLYRRKCEISDDRCFLIAVFYWTSRPSAVSSAARMTPAGGSTRLNNLNASSA